MHPRNFKPLLGGLITALGLALACVSGSGRGQTPAEPAGGPVVFVEAVPDPVLSVARDDPADAVARPVVDEDARASAKRQFEAAVERYDAHDYAGALAHFKQAYALEPSPELLWNIGRCQTLVGDIAAACASYAQLIANGGTAHDLAANAFKDLGC